MELHVEKVKSIRKRKKLTSEELAKMMGITRVTLGAWENAKRTPSEAKIRMLAKVLDVPPNEISDLEPDKPISGINLVHSNLSINSLIIDNKEKELNRVTSLVSGIMGMNKELSSAKLIIGAMVSSLPSIFYIKGTNLKYITANKVFLKNLSLNKNYVVFGKTDSDFFPQNEAKINYEMDKEVLATGKSILNREGYIPGSRKTKWGLISKVPVLDTEEKIQGVVGYCVDITERKQAEEALKLSQESLFFAAEGANLGIWNLDTVTGELICNNRGKTLFGIPIDETVNYQRFCDALYPDDLQMTDKAVKNAIEQHKDFNVDFRNIWPDGSIHWIEAKGHAYYDTDGKAIRMEGISLDITERKTTERNMAKEKNFADSLFNTARTIMLVLDTKGNILTFNPFMEEISGYKIEEVQGKDWFSTFLLESDRSNIKKLFLKGIDDIAIHGNVNPIVTKGGQTRYIEWYDKAIKDEDGKIVGLLSVGQDITERRKAEEELLVHQTELEMQNEELHHMQSKLDAGLAHYYDLYNFAPVGFCTVSENGLILEANLTAATLLGLTRSKLIEQSFFLFIHPEDQDIYYFQRKKILATGRLQLLEMRMLRADGSSFLAYLQSAPIQNGAYRIAFNDITEAKKIERMSGI